VLLDEVGRKEMLAVGRVRKFFESLVKTLRHPPSKEMRPPQSYVQMKSLLHRRGSLEDRGGGSSYR
jgi:hypothetical protein